MNVLGGLLGLVIGTLFPLLLLWIAVEIKAYYHGWPATEAWLDQQPTIPNSTIMGEPATVIGTISITLGSIGLLIGLIL